MIVDMHQTVSTQPSEGVVEARSNSRGQRPNLFKSLEGSFLVIYTEGLKEIYIFIAALPWVLPRVLQVLVFRQNNGA